jgi:selenocysteine lyase/cysteine desulfurase
MIYADNAATCGFCAPGVLETVAQYCARPGNPGHSTCQAGIDLEKKIGSVRKSICRFFHFDHPERVIFTSGLTEAMNLLVSSTIEKGDTVLCDLYSHNALLRTLHHTGANMIVYDGSREDLQRKLEKHPDAKAVFANHISNVTGQSLDLYAIGEVCKDSGCSFFVDSAQSAGILPIDMDKMHIDGLCFTGHKSLHALPGIGGLCVSERVSLKPLRFGGTGMHSFDLSLQGIYPDDFEAGTRNTPGILALEKGIEWAKQTGLETIEAKLNALSKMFLDGVKDDARFEIAPVFGDTHGIVSLKIKGMDAAVLGWKLSQKGICVRTGVHCAPWIHEKLHSKGLVRFSFGYENTKEEVQTCVDALLEIADAN